MVTNSRSMVVLNESKNVDPRLDHVIFKVLACLA